MIWIWRFVSVCNGTNARHVPISSHASNASNATDATDVTNALNASNAKGNLLSYFFMCSVFVNFILRQWFEEFCNFLLFGSLCKVVIRSILLFYYSIFRHLRSILSWIVIEILLLVCKFLLDRRIKKILAANIGISIFYICQ